MYFKYDIKVGLKKTIPWFFIVSAMTIATSVVLYINYNTDIKHGVEISNKLTLMDYYVNMFGGKLPFYITGEKFQLPVTWFLINIILCYFTGKYPYSELYNNHGMNVLIRGGSRERWFLSKWVWCILCVILYYSIAYATLLLFCLLCNIPITLSVNPTDYAGINSAIVEGIPIEGIQLLLLPIIVSVAIVTIQLALGLVIGPFLSFTTIGIIFVVSAYYVSPILIGNCSMILRNRMYLEEGINFTVSLIMAIIETIVFLLGGIIVFRKTNVLKKN